MLVAGSYDKYILGWTLRKQSKKKKSDNNTAEQADEEKGEPLLKQNFIHQAHMGPVKCMAMAGPVLATGGEDDTIRIFDLASGCDMGSLQKHYGSITALAFFVENPDSSQSFPKNLLSGSQDGTVRIWDSDLWVDLKVMKAHKKGVNDLCIHPSGKLALSVGRDCHLSMFNLIKGRRTFSSNLHKEATVIDFNLGGRSYSMVVERDVFVHHSEDARLLQTLSHGNRVLSIAHDENGLLLTGGEEATIRAWDLGSGKIAYALENAHKSRIKGISVLGSYRSSEPGSNPYLVGSASSDGIIRVWDVRMAKKESPTPLAEVDSKIRLTCLVGSMSNRMKKTPPVVSQGNDESNPQDQQPLLVGHDDEGNDKVDATNERPGCNSERESPQESNKTNQKKKKPKKVLGVKGTQAMKAKGHKKLKEKE